MNELEIFCNLVKNRSNENSKAIQLLYQNRLYGICVGILRQELDSMVRVLFLLTCTQQLRLQFIKQTLNNEKWHIEKKNITDSSLVKNILKMHGWARNVYRFGCSFIHFSIFHYYTEQDPFLKLPRESINSIKNFMVQYQEFPKEKDINFSTMQPYLLKIFDKINKNLE